MKLFEDLTQDEIRDVASQRLEAEIDKQNNIARNIDSYINSHSIIKQQADLFKKWVSLDYQASEAMESVNADYYYTHIQKENFAYHTTKLIEEILENEDEDSATAIATRIIYKCQLQNNGKIEVENLIGKIYDIEESIIDNYDFGCDWIDADKPDIYDVDSISRWYRLSEFKNFLKLLVVRNKLKEHRDKLKYPEYELQLINKAEAKRARNEAKRIKTTNAEIKKWAYDNLVGNIDKTTIIDIWNLIEIFLTEKETPTDIKPVTDTGQLTAKDFSSFIWVIWHLQRDTSQISIDKMVDFIRELFPAAFTYKGKLTQPHSIKAHLKYDTGEYIKIPDKYKNE